MHTSKYLFEHEGKKYFYTDITQAFSTLGIKREDRLFVHSDLKSFGRTNPGISKNEYVDAFILALMKLVGPNGTIVVPTFSYSFCKKEVFDVEQSRSTIGILTEQFRKMKDVVRTCEPIFSTAVWGQNKDYYAKVGRNCFGENSIFHKIYLDNFKILFIGETFDITYMHFVEQKYPVPYRYMKNFSGQLKIANELKDYSVDYNVRTLESDVQYDLEKIAEFLGGKGVLKQVGLGYSKLRIVAAVDAFNAITEGLKDNIRLLLKG